MNKNFKDLTNKKFNKLTVIDFYKRVKTNKNTSYRYYWKCKCDCGNISIVRGDSLINDKVKSCGCLRKDRLGYSVASRNSLYSNYKNSAIRRGYNFNLTINEFEKLTKSNCFYCGIEPKQIFKNNFNNGNYIYNGIDRIDNSEGYFLENCVPCCGDCNLSKGTKTYDEFIDWINRILKYWSK